MPITVWKPFWETRLPVFRNEMERLFEEFFDVQENALRGGAWLPAIDVHETKKDVVVTIDLPAVDPADLSVSITRDRLHVQGERKKEEHVDEESCHRSERLCGTFERAIDLPVDVVGEKARARCKNGVLKITVPKSRKGLQKEIKIKVT